MSAADSSPPDDNMIDVEDQDRIQLRGLLLEGARSPIVGAFDSAYFVGLRHAVSVSASKLLLQ